MFPHRLAPPVAFEPVEHRPNGEVARHVFFTAGTLATKLGNVMIHTLLEWPFPFLIIGLY